MKPNYIKDNQTNRARIWKIASISAMAVLIAVSLILAIISCVSIFKSNEDYAGKAVEVFTVSDIGDYDEDSTKCRVQFQSQDGNYLYYHTYSYEEWEQLPEAAEDYDETGLIHTTVTAHIFETADGTYAVFAPEHRSAEKPLPTPDEIMSELRAARVLKASPLINAAMAVLLAAIGFAIMGFAGKHFTTYEKCWFLSIMVLAGVFAILFPEEDVNGINGLVIMGLYLLDTLLNILCELLISKQSKWNFIVSVFVEITEIAICLVLAYRFATMVSTLFFWLPIDIVSFINWNRHPDRKEDELTQVRRLRGWMEVLILVGIALWTVGIGYLLTMLDFGTDLFHGNEALYIAVCYLDACVTAVGIANGLLIFFRFEEQWFAWIMDAVLEGVINILSGQFVLLVLKAGYLTNSTYGYIKWRKYIKAHPELQRKWTFF